MSIGLGAAVRLCNLYLKTENIKLRWNGEITVWVLDTDYDGSNLYLWNIFSCMTRVNFGCARLMLKAESNEDLKEA